MQKMIKTVLERIEKNGFEAYLVGGYVRDSLLGIKTTDIDICTNALPKDLVNIFVNISGVDNSYGVIKIINDKYNFDITTYRKESKYVGHKPGEIEYINNLLVDINRRDFTINALCMNSRGQLIDLVDGRQDLKHKLIRAVGNAEKRIKEDPLRILRAVRFATILDFRIDDELMVTLVEQASSIKSLSLVLIKRELDKIFASKNVRKGITLLKELNILELLGIKAEQIAITEDVCGIYSQLELPADYPLSNAEKSSIEDIKAVVKEGKINAHIMFDKGYYSCLIASKILGIESKLVCKLHAKMPLTEKTDLKIEILEICNIMGIEPNKLLKVIIDDLVKEILDDKLDNNHKAITNYLVKNRKRWLNEKSD